MMLAQNHRPPSNGNRHGPYRRKDTTAKVIARAGISSRRKAEELIQSGQVTVNGEVITTLGTRVDPAHDHIKISGKHLPAPAPDMF